MKIGIVGAGLFGCHIACTLHEEGYEVEIIERYDSIMEGATRLNQQRLHRGYHYPRSEETALECRTGAHEFKRCYPGVTYSGIDRLYAIAKEDSQTSPDEFEAFMKRMDLEFEEYTKDAPINRDMVDMIYAVNEESIDPHLLSREVRKNIDDRGIKIRLGTPASEDTLKEYDHVVVCCYDGNNRALADLGMSWRRLPQIQYELVEKPVLAMPLGFGYRTSVVIMDGPFCSLDPAGRAGETYLMGHVEHAILARNISVQHNPGSRWKDYVNQQGIHKATHAWDAMQEAGSKYIPQLAWADRVGSYYVTRAVRPYREATDERRTIVTPMTSSITQVFSGKLPSVCQAARDVIAILEMQDGSSDLAESHQSAQVSL